MPKRRVTFNVSFTLDKEDMPERVASSCDRIVVDAKKEQEESEDVKAEPFDQFVESLGLACSSFEIAPKMRAQVEGIVSVMPDSSWSDLLCALRNNRWRVSENIHLCVTGKHVKPRSRVWKLNASIIYWEVQKVDVRREDFIRLLQISHESFTIVK
jgi:hypothetical protein